MGKQKTDLSVVTLNQLTALTGKAYRTLKKLLSTVQPESEESGTIYYCPAEVLPIIYGVDKKQFHSGEDPEAEPLDPVQEKARLDKLKGDKVAIEISVLRKDLIPAQEVETRWGKLTSACRTRILNLPAKVAPRICAVKDIKEVEKILKAECKEALKELSEYDGELDRSPDCSQSS